MRHLIATALMLAALGAPTLVQAQPTDLPVEAGKSWTHPHSKIVVPVSVAGSARINARQFTSDALDVAFGYGTKGKDAITVFIFRDTNGGVPVWLAQAQRAIELRTDITTTLTLPPVSFTPAGRPEGSGLRAVYSVTGDSGGQTATGVALVGVNGWYVKVRVTSFGGTPTTVANQLDRVIADLRLPGSTALVDPVEPVGKCPTRLLAGVATSDAPAATGVGVSAPAPTLRAARWCLDSVIEQNTAVYRPDGATDKYLLAVGDNGNGMAVTQQAGYAALNFFIASHTFVLTPQDRLPAGSRAWALIKGNAIQGKFSSWPAR